MSSRSDSDFQRLLERARQAEQRAAEADRARQEADRARQEADRARQEADQRTQKTTLLEFLHACHQKLHVPLRVESVKSRTTKGGITSPRNKYYPNTLSPWKEFPRIQQDTCNELLAYYHRPERPALRLFSSLLALEDLSENHGRVRLANELGLRHYETLAVEVPVTRIINHLCESEQTRHHLQLGQGITFENDPNSLSDAAEEVQERLHIQPPETPPLQLRPTAPYNLQPDPSSDSNLDRTRADQYCVYKEVDDQRKLMFIVEYKPPHKLSIGNLRAGFREMDLKKEVIDRITVPTYKESDCEEVGGVETKKSRAAKELREAKLQYNADQLIAAVATQTFHYMIQNGLEYSYITSGEAFVFLHIDEHDPTTLYYHLAIPSEDVSADDFASSHSQTAISQVASLCLLASRSEPRTQQWRKEAKKQLKRYRIDWQSILDQIPPSERKLTPVSAFKGRKGSVVSKYNLRSWHGQGNPRKPRDDDPDDPGAPNSSSGASTSNSNEKSNPGGGTDNRGGSSGNNTPTHGGPGTQRQYCTQKCLLGITQGCVVDESCPNASSHPRLGDQHALKQLDFLGLIQKQLAEDLDHDCEPLGLQGARGALFKITLASHGYVFVGKGTVRAFVPDLLHEGAVYRRLEALQGTAVPVCLGNIHLLEKYYLDVGVRILHMLLMSWAGEAADSDEAVKGTAWLQQETKRTVAEVRREGIDQDDVRSPNLLWNREVQRVVLIDFERATVIGGKVRVDSHTLQEVSPNKRRKHAESARGRKKLGFAAPQADGLPVDEC